MPISQKSLVLQMKLIASDAGIEEFAGSNGWIWRFLKRYRLTVRRATCVPKKLPQN